MTTFSNAFRAEVVRMARKELKPELQAMRKSLTSHRSDIASLKREVKALTSQLKATKRLSKTDQPRAEEAAAEPRRGGRQWTFKPEALTAKRIEFGVTGLDMARLLQASPLTVRKWEAGNANPRAAQLVRIRDVLAMAKRKALSILAEAE